MLDASTPSLQTLGCNAHQASGSGCGWGVPLNSPNQESENLDYALWSNIRNDQCMQPN